MLFFALSQKVAGVFDFSLFWFFLLLYIYSDHITFPRIICLISYIFDTNFYKIFSHFSLGPFFLPKWDRTWRDTPRCILPQIEHISLLWLMFSNSILSCLQAFAWWPELLAEHAEKFLSLYSVDMDSALEAQPQDSWDSFPLFQLLNNALRNDSKILIFFYMLLA